MQTFLRGRDLISDLDFSKEEVETVLDVRGSQAQAPLESPIPICGTRPLG